MGATPWPQFETLTLLRNEVAGGAGVGGGESSSGTGLASLLVLRLDPDELGFRPIPVLGPLGQVSRLGATRCACVRAQQWVGVAHTAAGGGRRHRLVRAQVAASELETAPRTSQEGAFGAFTIGGQDAACTWVVSTWGERKAPVARVRVPKLKALTRLTFAFVALPRRRRCRNGRPWP